MIFLYAKSVLDRPNSKYYISKFSLWIMLNIFHASCHFTCTHFDFGHILEDHVWRYTWVLAKRRVIHEYQAFEQRPLEIVSYSPGWQESARLIGTSAGQQILQFDFKTGPIRLVE